MGQLGIQLGVQVGVQVGVQLGRQLGRQLGIQLSESQKRPVLARRHITDIPGQEHCHAAPRSAASTSATPLRQLPTAEMRRKRRRNPRNHRENAHENAYETAVKRG